MERVSPLHSAETSARRVSSPSAAKTAACCRRLAALASPLGRDMFLDVLHLRRPTPIVHAERLGPAVGGNPVEARLGQAQQRAGGGLLEAELDQRWRLLRVVLVGI